MSGRARQGVRASRRGKTPARQDHVSLGEPPSRFLRDRVLPEALHSSPAAPLARLRPWGGGGGRGKEGAPPPHLLQEPDSCGLSQVRVEWGKGRMREARAGGNETQRQTEQGADKEKGRKTHG